MARLAIPLMAHYRMDQSGSAGWLAGWYDVARQERITIAHIQQYGGQHHGRLSQIFWQQVVGTDSSNSGSDGIFGMDNWAQPRAELDPFSA